MLSFHRFRWAGGGLAVVAAIVAVSASTAILADPTSDGSTAVDEVTAVPAGSPTISYDPVGSLLGPLMQVTPAPSPPPSPPAAAVSQGSSAPDPATAASSAHPLVGGSPSSPKSSTTPGSTPPTKSSAAPAGAAPASAASPAPSSAALVPIAPVSITPLAAPTPSVDLASGIYQAMNRDRARYGLAPLAWNNQLAGIAQNWAEWMARNNSMTHQNMNNFLGQTGFSTMGENILYAPSFYGASDMELQWMNSAPHRANILNPSFTAVGIGVAVAPDGTIWACANFGG